MDPIRITAAALGALGALQPLTARADSFTRLDVLALVNADAHNWMIDADNSRLDIEFLRLPRPGIDIGKVCGPIVSLRRKPAFDAKGSYVASLVVENGKLRVVGITTLFMPIDELLTTNVCR